MAGRNHYFFVGIGGSGMSALADLIRRQGNVVSGSDRGHDHGDVPDKFATLAQSGMTLHKQDGSGVDQSVNFVVVSSAVEESIPDIQNARKLNIPVIKRAELLSSLFNKARGIGIAGTSGKTTTTGMTGWMLHAMGLDPTIANGGIMPNFVGHPQSLMGNAVGGKGDLFVAEMDESDGTISFFNPEIAVLNNITLDHKPFSVIEPLFADYLTRARMAVVNLDDPRAAKMANVHPLTITYAVDNPAATLFATNLQHQQGGISFTLNDRTNGTSWPCNLPVPGRHNVSNALAAFSVAKALNQPLDKAVTALEAFKGIKRRMEVLGTAGGVTVIDDFGHNPDKIAATLDTLTAHPGRVIVMFQPHGFGPMKMMRKELVEAFTKGLRKGDTLTMPEIFYAGGTVTKDISSNDLIGDITAGGRDAHFFQTRDDAGAFMLANAKAGDRIVIMGARDDTLSEFAKDILQKLKAAPAPIVAGAQP
ncbi:MAG: UDP-N-acetylmuramate--alanine ligase [Micavibrio sp.]|nr:UDP-N-acetylmuramate--alanine ligase [Micavibrio sp.]